MPVAAVVVAVGPVVDYGSWKGCSGSCFVQKTGIVIEIRTLGSAEEVWRGQE